VEFLGYIISPKGISMDPAKVAVITSWAVPTCVREIQVFLGVSNFYRRFIKNFSKLSQANDALSQKKTSFSSGIPRPKPLSMNSSARSALNPC